MREYKTNADFITFLIANGADVHAKTNDGTTPLHIAMYNGNGVDIIKVLLSNGADVNAKDNAGKTPLDLAKYRNNTRVVKYLESIGQK